MCEQYTGSQIQLAIVAPLSSLVQFVAPWCRQWVEKTIEQLRAIWGRPFSKKIKIVHSFGERSLKPFVITTVHSTASIRHWNQALFIYFLDWQMRINKKDTIYKVCSASILFGSLVDLVHELNKHLLLDTSRLIDLVNQGSQLSVALVLISLVDRLNVQVLVQLLDFGFSLSVLLAIVFLQPPPVSTTV